MRELHPPGRVGNPLSGGRSPKGAADFTIAVGEIPALHGFGDGVCVPAVAWIDRHLLTPVFASARAATPAGRVG